MRDKAQEKLDSHRPLEEALTNAVCEIVMMDEDEVPKYKWSSIQAILDSCRTHEAEGKEGIFRASINNMTYEKKKSLKRQIELL